MSQDLQEKRDQRRFIAEILALAVAAGSTIFSGWQTFLTRQQFIASEQHWRADRDTQNEARRYELRPIIVPTSPGVSSNAKQNLDYEPSSITIVNLGKGPALTNICIEWEIESNPLGFCVLADKMFLQPGQTASVSHIPFLEFEQAAIKKGEYPNKQVEIGGRVTLRYESGYGEVIETRQEVSVLVGGGRGDRQVQISFKDREFVVYRSDSEMNEKWKSQWEKALKNMVAIPPPPAPTVD